MAVRLVHCGSAKAKVIQTTPSAAVAKPAVLLAEKMSAKNPPNNEPPKAKKYPPWRLDLILSKTKYSSIHYVENGGWHFTNIKSPEEIEIKLSNFLHHQDFEDSGLKLDDVKKMVRNKKILYDHSADQREFKWKGSVNLKKVALTEMPEYLNENYKKYSKWLEI